MIVAFRSVGNTKRAESALLALKASAAVGAITHLWTNRVDNTNRAFGKEGRGHALMASAAFRALALLWLWSHKNLCFCEWTAAAFLFAYARAGVTAILVAPIRLCDRSLLITSIDRHLDICID